MALCVYLCRWKLTIRMILPKYSCIVLATKWLRILSLPLNDKMAAILRRVVRNNRFVTNVIDRLRKIIYLQLWIVNYTSGVVVGFGSIANKSAKRVAILPQDCLNIPFCQEAIKKSLIKVSRKNGTFRWKVRSQLKFIASKMLSSK